jgi:hypothetical protein
VRSIGRYGQVRERGAAEDVREPGEIAGAILGHRIELGGDPADDLGLRIGVRDGLAARVERSRTLDDVLLLHAKVVAPRHS